MLRLARPPGVRRTLLSLLVVILGLSITPYPGAPAAASCAAPSLSLDGHEPSRKRVELVRGRQVTVVGRGFVNGCADSGDGTSTFGCSGDDEGKEPRRDVELLILQGRPPQQQSLVGVTDAGSADDGRLGWASWTFTVPEHLELGPAHLTADTSGPLRIRIVG
jgi:hypothetical protein